MRTEAQKRADKKYVLTHKGEYIMWGTSVRKELAKEYDKILKEHGLTKAEFIRKAIKTLF